MNAAMATQQQAIIPAMAPAGRPALCDAAGVLVLLDSTPAEVGTGVPLLTAGSILV